MSFLSKSSGICAVIMLLCSHQALMHSCAFVRPVSQVFLQAVATRESWEAAGSHSDIPSVSSCLCDGVVCSVVSVRCVVLR